MLDFEVCVWGGGGAVGGGGETEGARQREMGGGGMRIRIFIELGHTQSQRETETRGAALRKFAEDM